MNAKQKAELKRAQQIAILRIWRGDSARVIRLVREAQKHFGAAVRSCREDDNMLSFALHMGLARSLALTAAWLRLSESSMMENHPQRAAQRINILMEMDGYGERSLTFERTLLKRI